MAPYVARKNCVLTSKNCAQKAQLQMTRNKILYAHTVAPRCCKLLQFSARACACACKTLHMLHNALICARSAFYAFCAVCIHCRACNALCVLFCLLYAARYFLLLNCARSAFYMLHMLRYCCALCCAVARFMHVIRCALCARAFACCACVCAFCFILATTHVKCAARAFCYAVARAVACV